MRPSRMVENGSNDRTAAAKHALARLSGLDRRLHARIQCPWQRPQPGTPPFPAASQNLSFWTVSLLQTRDYSCTHKSANMSKLPFHLHLHSSHSCVRVYTHVYVFPSSSISIHPCCHIHMYVWCSLLYWHPPFWLSFSCCTNLIDAFFTDITLSICLDSFCICMFILLTSAFHKYACANLCTHFPTLEFHAHLSLCTYVHTFRLFCNDRQDKE